jgi:cytochrome P450
MENPEKSKSKEFIPFSSGPRSCTSAMLATTMVKLTCNYMLQKFNIKTINGKKTKMLGSITSIPSEPILIDLEFRRKSTPTKQFSDQQTNHQFDDCRS